MLRNYVFSLICCSFLCSFNSLVAQNPTVRKITPAKETTIRNIPIEKKQVAKDTSPGFKGVYNKNPGVLNSTWTNMFSLLEFSNFFGGGAEFPMEWEFKKTGTKEISDSPLSKNWEKSFTWRHIPPGTVYGRWEISKYPFPLQDMPGFSGIIRTGLIETKGADSVFFKISYTDDANLKSNQRGEKKNIKEVPVKIQPAGKRPEEKVVLAKRQNNPSTNTTNPINSRTTKIDNNPVEITGNTMTANLFSGMQLLEEGPRKFYIRIVPLNKEKQSLLKISNAVSLQEVFFKGIPPAKKQIYLSDDYTITAVKYVPIRYPDPNFANCTVITSYTTPEKTDQVKQNKAFGFGDNEIFALKQDQFATYFQAAFPIGTVLCPEPPKEKAWYEKALNGISGFVTKAWDGAANFYNTTKGLIQDKFIELNCNANLVTTVINPVTKLQEATGPEVCGLIAEAAFDYGMAAIGIPPSIPTSDEFVKLAEGQIVELACDELESQTGVPLPEEAREAIRKEFHDKVISESNKGIIQCGFFNVKPDPRGFFQTAYYEIEITRTGNNYKGKGIVSFSIADITTRSISLWNPATKQNEEVLLKGNLFEPTSLRIPYIEQVGDKIKLYVLLKPQESYLHKNKQTNMINSVHHGPPLNEFYTPQPADPTYYSITNSPGFNILKGGGSVSEFTFGLKNYKFIYTNK